VLALLERFVPNDGDAWTYTLRALKEYRRQVRGPPEPMPPAFLSAGDLLAATETGPPPLADELLGPYLPAARRLGQRTADLHRALSAAAGHPDLAPQPFSRFYQRSVYQSLRGLTSSVIHTLRDRLPRLPATLRGDARRILDAEGELLDRFKTLTNHRLTATRIACHGNYHLQQVLRTEDDFVIIDFEGEPPRPLFERRLKRSRWWTSRPWCDPSTTRHALPCPTRAPGRYAPLARDIRITGRSSGVTGLAPPFSRRTSRP
jgi:maltose alpha-D-glucosyltransferase/alpha-amylase